MYSRRTQHLAAFRKSYWSNYTRIQGSGDRVYILTATARRKGGRRHISVKSNSIECLVSVIYSPERYHYEVFTADWKKIGDYDECSGVFLKDGGKDE